MSGMIDNQFYNRFEEVDVSVVHNQIIYLPCPDKENDSNYEKYLNQYNYRITKKSIENRDISTISYKFSFSSYYINGKKFNSKSAPFIIKLRIGKRDIEKWIKFYIDLLINESKFELSLTKYDLNDITTNAHLLVEEAFLFNILSTTREEWRKNIVSYSLNFDESCGSICKAVIMGDTDNLSQFCQEYNEVHMHEPDRKISDKVHALLSIPLIVFKSTTDDIETYIKDHFPYKEVSKPINIARHHVIWTSMGLRKKSCFKKNESCLLNCRDVFINQGKEIPYWAFEENEEFDNNHSILLTITKFQDIFNVAIPAGKRGLGETSFQCVVRETREEIGLNIANQIISGRSEEKTVKVMKTKNDKCLDVSDITKEMSKLNVEEGKKDIFDSLEISESGKFSGDPVDSLTPVFEHLYHFNFNGGDSYYLMMK